MVPASPAIMRACFFKRSDTTMQFPEWTKPAVYGVVVGAVAMAIVGFSWGGWVTGGGARKIADIQSKSMLTTALIPYCIERSKSDPDSVQVLADLKAASSYSRRGVVEKAGWATPLGTEMPNSDLAQACQLELSKTL